MQQGRGDGDEVGNRRSSLPSQPCRLFLPLRFLPFSSILLVSPTDGSSASIIASLPSIVLLHTRLLARLWGQEQVGKRTWPPPLSLSSPRCCSVLTSSPSPAIKADDDAVEWRRRESSSPLRVRAAGTNKEASRFVCVVDVVLALSAVTESLLLLNWCIQGVR